MFCKAAANLRIRVFQRLSAFDQCAFSFLLFGDVLMDGNPATIRHWLMVDGIDAPIAQLVLYIIGSALGHFLETCKKVLLFILRCGPSA